MWFHFIQIQAKYPSSLANKNEEIHSAVEHEV